MKRFVLAALILLASDAFAAVPEPMPGKDYLVINGGRPLDPVSGAVVVEECFNYICPSCNSFEPTFTAWARKLPPYVKVHRVPASFRADFAVYARAYYAAEVFGLVDKTHQAVYDAIHKSHLIPAEGDRPDEARVAAFYGKYGVDSQQFLAAMQSFSVDVKARRAYDYMIRSKIPETPSIIVNGRYLVQAATYDDLCRIATYLIEKERPR